jgi:hypothetical protein
MDTEEEGPRHILGFAPEVHSQPIPENLLSKFYDTDVNNVFTAMWDASDDIEGLDGVTEDAWETEELLCRIAELCSASTAGDIPQFIVARTAIQAIGFVERLR